MTRKRLAAKSPRVKINVTDEDIEKAERRNSSHCMIAEAIHRILPEARHITVDLATIRFSDLVAGRRYIYLTPVKAQRALLDYDQGDMPQPFSMELAAAHVVATGTGRKGRAELRTVSDSSVPVRVGGYPPARGPLRVALDTNHSRAAQQPEDAPPEDRPVGIDAEPDIRTGRRREFGLRAMIR
jgi:hypothetical protein